MQAVRIDQVDVREIMVPREEIVALDVAEPFRNAIDKIAATKHTRYPVISGSLEDFAGILYLPEVFAHLDELLDGTVSPAEIAAEPMAVKAGLSVSDLIDLFQEQNHELALVFDFDDATVVGLVTLTDAVEKIVGQAEDPLDVMQSA